MPRIVEPTMASIDDAAARLDAGQVVAFPTETVYGLGADTANAKALRRIFELKGRPLDNPLIAHVHDIDEARSLVQAWPDAAETLARRFWPGPLTLILPKREVVPNEATAGRPTIALRSPRHPIARALLNAFGRPISAPSANRSGFISPTRADHVAHDFADVHDLLILDGGSSECGIESTVLDLTTAPPRVLRPGHVSRDELVAALGREIDEPAVTEQTASPGTSARHYAPHTPVQLLSTDELHARLAAGANSPPLVALVICEIAAPPPHQVIVMPKSPDAYGAMLYDTLRCADAMSAQMILIERPPIDNALWLAVHNRLQRAATPE